MFLEFFVDWLEKVSHLHWAMGSVHKYRDQRIVYKKSFHRER
jgi:hypothetical protein